MSKDAKSAPLMDPPEHTPYRGALERGFRPRRVAAMEGAVREVVVGVLDEAMARETVDFVEDVAGKITLGVLGGLLGAPEEDWPLLFQLATLTVGADDPEYAEPFAAGLSNPRTIAREVRRAAGELGFSGLRFLPLLWQASPSQRRNYLALYQGRGESVGRYVDPGDFTVYKLKVTGAKPDETRFRVYLTGGEDLGAFEDHFPEAGITTASATR